jgi:hypothetical protein
VTAIAAAHPTPSYKIILKQIWQEQASMKTARYAAAAGVYKSKNNEIFIVIAGGLGAVGGDNTNLVGSMEIYSLAQNRWIGEEKSEFFKFSYPASFQFGNSFVVMGGFIPDEGASDKIYAFGIMWENGVNKTLDENEDGFEISFVEVGKMSGGKAGFLAMLVPTNFACN